MPFRRLVPAMLTLSLLPAAGAAAADGRDFAGFWKLGEAADLGDHVAIPLTLQIQNYSGADLAAAQIVLEDPLAPGEDVAAFATVVDIPDGASVCAGDTVTVLLHEYERWGQGVGPRVRLLFTDAEGEMQRRPIELFPMLVDEQEEE